MGLTGASGFGAMGLYLDIISAVLAVVAAEKGLMVLIMAAALVFKM